MLTGCSSRAYRFGEMAILRWVPFRSDGGIEVDHVRGPIRVLRWCSHFFGLMI